MHWRNFLLLSLLLFPSALKAQDDFSWNNLVDWDGTTHWYRYMILSPGFQGPNALPVPESNQAIVLSSSSFTLETYQHAAPGDFTTNLFLRYYASYWDSRIAVEVNMVPLEYYRLSTAIRDERKLRSASPRGVVPGDLSFGTHIQLFRDHSVLPDASLSVFFRTASGRGSEDGRYIDAPGYYFTLNAGKSWKELIPQGNLRWFFQGGFYAWQTNLDNYYQNDAVVFGAGLSGEYNNWNATVSIDSYWGYLGRKNRVIVETSSKPYSYSGDEPVVFRFRIGYKLKTIDYSIKYQYGIQDFPYQSIGLGINFKLS